MHVLLILFFACEGVYYLLFPQMLFGKGILEAAPLSLSPTQSFLPFLSSISRKSRAIKSVKTKNLFRSFSTIHSNSRPIFLTR